MGRVFLQFSSGDFGCMVIIQWMLRHGPCRLLLVCSDMVPPEASDMMLCQYFAACIFLTIVLLYVDVGWQQQEGLLGVACLRTVLQRYALLQCMLRKELVRAPLVDCLVLFMVWKISARPGCVPSRLLQTILPCAGWGRLLHLLFSQIYLWQSTC